MSVAAERKLSSEPPTASGASDAARLRSLLLLLLLLESLGVGAELLLVGHTEDLWQWLPIVLLGALVGTAIWCLSSGRAAAVRSLQVLMALVILSGGIGFLQHYRAKVEFQLEVNPSLAGWPLFWETVKSQSPPALAPGVMIQMGLLGLLYAYRHPALRKPSGNGNRINTASAMR